MWYYFIDFKTFIWLLAPIWSLSLHDWDSVQREVECWTILFSLVWLHCDCIYSIVHQSSFTKPCKPWQYEYEFYSGDFFVLNWTRIFLSGHQVLITKRQNGLFVSPFQNDPYEWLLKMGSQRVSVVRNSVSIHLNLLPVTLYYHNVLKLCFSERTVTVTTRDCLLENT